MSRVIRRPTRQSKLEREFWVFHRDNPQVYDLLVQLTRQWVAAGNDKLGISMVYEVCRWQIAMETTANDGFKLNNNHRAFYSRLIMEREPELAGVFDIREQHAV